MDKSNIQKIKFSSSKISMKAKQTLFIQMRERIFWKKRDFCCLFAENECATESLLTTDRHTLRKK